MNRTAWACLLALSILPLNARVSCQSPKGQSRGDTFRPEAAPSTSDWQRFFTLTESELKHLWSAQTREGLSFEKWSWQWRLGWVRVCSDPSRINWCEPILKSALKDEAAVVRAEGATVFSKVFKGHAKDTHLALLIDSFKQPGNFRNGKPLFVCEQILAAIIYLNHPQSANKAKELTKSYPKLRTYLSKLAPSPKRKIKG